MFNKTKKFASLNRSLIPGLFLILPFVATACGLRSNDTPTPDPAMTGTAAAQTVEAGGAASTIQAQSAQLTAQVAFLQSTQQALAASQTAMAPGTPTLAGTTSAQTPQTNEGPTLSVSADTNCRQGPGTQYAIVSLLKVGAKTAVQGKDASGQWFYVASPSGSGSCWLWSQFATLQGNTAGLQIVNAPPPPAATAVSGTITPTVTGTTESGEGAFVASFANIHACGGDVVSVLVQNTGETTYRSARVTVREPVTGAVLGQFVSDNAFLASESGCPPGSGSLASGASAFVVGSLDDSLPSGAAGRIVVELCTGAGMGGDCQETKFDFSFP